MLIEFEKSCIYFVINVKQIRMLKSKMIWTVIGWSLHGIQMAMDLPLPCHQRLMEIWHETKNETNNYLVNTLQQPLCIVVRTSSFAFFFFTISLPSIFLNFAQVDNVNLNPASTLKEVLLLGVNGCGAVFLLQQQLLFVCCRHWSELVKLGTTRFKFVSNLSLSGLY